MEIRVHILIGKDVLFQSYQQPKQKVDRRIGLLSFSGSLLPIKKDYLFIIINKTLKNK
jgi:hypothetical protein